MEEILFWCIALVFIILLFTTYFLASYIDMLEARIRRLEANLSQVREKNTKDTRSAQDLRKEVQKDIEHVREFYGRIK